MCGLIGMISRKDFGFGFKDKAIFEQLLFSDTLRGVDSTGIFGVNKYGNLLAHKTAAPASNALRTATFQEFLGKIYTDYKIVMGHNRAATRGATTDENAHPFVEDNICLIHNGTLTSHKQLADKEVDSHAICHSLAVKGYEETFKNINGAFALIWYDADTKKLYMARNKERPLHMVMTDDTFYFASELKMLEWILHRNNVVSGKSFFLGVDKTYIWDLDKSKDYQVVDTPKREIKPFNYKDNNYYGGYQGLLEDKANHYPKKRHRHSRNSDKTYGKYYGTDTPDDDEGISYFSGDVVEIYNKGAAESKRGNLNLIGYTIDGTNTPITCQIPEKLSDKALQELIAAEYLQATVSMIYNTNGKQSLYMRDPIILEDELTTLNHKKISRAILEEHGGKCNTCQTQLSMAEPDDIQGSVAVFEAGKLKTITCSDCTADLTSWGCYTGGYYADLGDY